MAVLKTPAPATGSSESNSRLVILESLSVRLSFFLALTYLKKSTLTIHHSKWPGVCAGGQREDPLSAASQYGKNSLKPRRPGVYWLRRKAKKGNSSYS